MVGRNDDFRRAWYKRRRVGTTTLRVSISAGGGIVIGSIFIIGISLLNTSYNSSL